MHACRQYILGDVSNPSLLQSGFPLNSYPAHHHSGILHSHPVYLQQMFMEHGQTQVSHISQYTAATARDC